MTLIGATLCPPQFDPRACEATAAIAISVSARVQRECRLTSWINFPLLNASGTATDFALTPPGVKPIPTPFAHELPYAMEIISALSDEGLRIRHVRIAVLLERDVLRPHVDEYPSTRLIVALNEEGTDFRYVFDDICFTMRPGQVWQVRGEICHGAANIGTRGKRVALLLDAALGATPWSDRRLSIPSEQLVPRPPWDTVARTSFYRAAETLALSGRCADAERIWLFAPFEYGLAAAAVYDEVLLFARHLAQESSHNRRYWRRRADYLLHPRLKCEVTPRELYSPDDQSTHPALL